MSEWVQWSEIPLSWIREVETSRRNPGNQRTRQVRKYKELCCAWDIETARIPGTEEAAVYHWQFQLGPDHPTVYGRYLEEFPLFLDRLCEHLDPEQTLVIYVHNLSYEFHFLRGVEPIDPTDVFSIKNRKPVRVWLRQKKIELRCSYILTNMSLGAWTSQMGVEHKKESSEEYDHTIVRYPWSDLTPEELRYCRNDVLGLVEALQVQLDLHGDSLATIPLTSTGYVRRDVKRVMETCSYWTKQNVQPSDEVYLALREAFRGGNTHGNRWLTGCILDNVGSADRSSSYPDVCINRPMPMSALRRNAHRYQKYLDQCVKDEIPFLARLRFIGLRLKNQYDPCPYLSYSNLRNVEDPTDTPPINITELDNGRILTCEACDTTITDVDWMIIRNHYVWDEMRVLDLWTSTYDYLPDMLRSLIIKYYRDKTELKGVAGQELQYNLAKALLNSIYGLMAQDPCKPKTLYNPDSDDLFQQVEGDVHELLAKSRNRPYKSYQWGIWVTAWARYELQQAIDAAGDMFVYCDTDSVKYAGELDLTKINRILVNRSKETGAIADDPKGRTHYMGEFEDEGRYLRFLHQGAKRYAFELPDDKLPKHRKPGENLFITVSGVDKEHGAFELMAAGGLKEFQDGMVFNSAGLDPKYNDRTDMDVEIDGHRLHIGPNVYLHPTTYTLGLGDSYGKLIRAVKVLRDLQHDNHIFNALQPRAK